MADSPKNQDEEYVPEKKNDGYDYLGPQGRAQPQAQALLAKNQPKDKKDG